MFGRKRKREPWDVEDQEMWLEVHNADEAWALLKWLLARVPGELGRRGYEASVRVIRYGSESTSYSSATGETHTTHVHYSVTFPRAVWDRALDSYAYAGAERKLRNEIFGKGKH